MKRQSKSKSKGLAGLIGGALVGAAALMPAGKAEGGLIEVRFEQTPTKVNGVQLYHVEDLGATEGYDSELDSVSSVNNNVDLFSKIPSYNLGVDARPGDSLSTFYNDLENKGTETLTGKLKFLIDNSTSPSFVEVPIWADIYKNNTLVVGNIDLKTNPTYTSDTLSLDSSDTYQINVRFVPEGGTLGMLGAGALAAGTFGLYNLITRRKEEEPKE